MRSACASSTEPARRAPGISCAVNGSVPSNSVQICPAHSRGARPSHRTPIPRVAVAVTSGLSSPAPRRLTDGQQKRCQRLSDKARPVRSPSEITCSVRSGVCCRVRLDHRPRVVGQVPGQVVQRSRGGQLLTYLGHGGVAGITTGPSVAGQRPIAGVEVHNHVAMVVVFTGLEPEFPSMWLMAVHWLIVERSSSRNQGRMSPSSLGPMTLSPTGSGGPLK